MIIDDQRFQAHVISIDPWSTTRSFGGSEWRRQRSTKRIKLTSSASRSILVTPPY
jgi:hypothetical protein